MDGNSSHVKKVLAAFDENDKAMAEVQAELDEGNEVAFPVSDFVRMLKERGQVSIDE